MIFVWFDIDSRVTLTMAQINNYKAPPKLTDDVDYENWKKKKKKEKKGNQNLKNIYFFGKAGCSNFLVFTGQTCKAILEIDPDLYAV